MKKLKALLQLTTALTVVGFCSLASAQIVVNLEVSPNEDELQITTHGACSRQPNNPGCVRASGQVQINFNLKGQTGCSAGGNWELDYVALGNGNKASPGNISQVAAEDFQADQGSGVVSPLSKSARHILIRDNNSQAYDIWYTVYAICEGSDSPITTDPRVENDGSGHP